MGLSLLVGQPGLRKTETEHKGPQAPGHTQGTAARVIRPARTASNAKPTPEQTKKVLSGASSIFEQRDIRDRHQCVEGGSQPQNSPQTVTRAQDSLRTFLRPGRARTILAPTRMHTQQAQHLPPAGKIVKKAHELLLKIARPDWKSRPPEKVSREETSEVCINSKRNLTSWNAAPLMAFGG